jgi:hypothetical protein
LGGTLYWWREGTFPADETFVGLSDPNEGATAVNCEAVHYEQLHAHFVPEADRTHELYGGYYLCIDIEWIMTRCKRVGTGEVTPR